MQSLANNEPARKFSFLVHTAVYKETHSWQKQIVGSLYASFIIESAIDSDIFNELILASYKELACSVSISAGLLPAYENIKSRLQVVLFEEQVMIVNINSEIQIESVLDDSGQLKLRSPYNIFIGGQILDRGVTIENLIAFYYGRRPKSFQQDTVLQHCRMFGYRSQEYLAVTRFYTGQAIYTAMKKMHESDSALREQFVKNPEQGVAFILGSKSGLIRLCNPSKIMLSQTTTLAPYKALTPIGFQTLDKMTTERATKKIDELLASFYQVGLQQSTFLIKTTIARYY